MPEAFFLLPPKITTHTHARTSKRKSLYKHPFTIDDEIPLYHSFGSKISATNSRRCRVSIYACAYEIVTINNTERHKSCKKTDE